MRREVELAVVVLAMLLLPTIGVALLAGPKVGLASASTVLLIVGLAVVPDRR